jgi:hypothetical protein
LSAGHVESGHRSFAIAPTVDRGAIALGLPET